MQVGGVCLYVFQQAELHLEGVTCVTADLPRFFERAGRARNLSIGPVFADPSTKLALNVRLYIITNIAD